MVGRVTVNGRTAVLGDDLKWSCPDDPELARNLETLYLDSPRGPAEGAPGHAMLHDLASRTGGAAEFAPKAPDPPGLVY